MCAKMNQKTIYGLILLLQIWTLLGESAMASIAHGVRHFLTADVYVIRPDGLPAANEEIFLAESIGGVGPILSERMKTDEKGKINLRGYYCMPMVVATNGGYISIDVAYISEKYTVQQRQDGVPIAKAFGKPDEELLRHIQEASTRNHNWLIR